MYKPPLMPNILFPLITKKTNENDSKAMENIAQRAKSILRTNDLTVLYDRVLPVLRKLGSFAISIIESTRHPFQ